MRFDGADMAKPAAISDMVERVGTKLRPDRYPGEQRGHPACGAGRGVSAEKWDAIQAINLSAAFHAIRVVLSEMKRRGFGRIVNIASAHGLIGSPFKSAYVAAKHGIVGLTKVVALESAEFGVTCNAVCPGYVWTPLVEKQVDGQATAHGISRDAVVTTTYSWRNSRPSASSPSRRSPAPLRSCAARVRLRSPGSLCRSMAAGPHIEMNRDERPVV